MPDALTLENAQPQNTQLEKAHSRKKHRKKKSRKGRGTGILTYLRIAWVDLFSITVIAGLMAGIYFAPINSYSTRVFPMWSSVLSMDMTDATHDLRAPIEFSYSFKEPPLNDWACGGVVLGVPLLFIALFQIRIRSIWDFHAGAVGVSKAVVTT